MNTPQQFHFQELIWLSVDGSSTPSQQEELNGILLETPGAIAEYLELIALYTELCVYGSVPVSRAACPDSESAKQYEELLHLLAVQEKVAETAIIEKPPLSEPLIEKVSYPKSVRKLNKTSLFFALFSSAALFFMIVFARYGSEFVPQPVATVSDAVNAVWGDGERVIAPGQRLSTRRGSLSLRAGYLKLLFDNNAVVVIEAPAEFEILNEDRIRLAVGKLYATVPQEAIGFMVDTATSRIIDLGTEFGVEATRDGTTELHVVKGKTTLVAGRDDRKVSLSVGQGFAKRISGPGQALTDIVCDDRTFARDISSKQGVVWKGEPIDLADVVSGGDGFGGSRLAKSIHPVTGTAAVGVTPTAGVRSETGNHAYNRVPDLPFVDGVFVPDGAGGPPQISSAGHRFADCPATSNCFWVEIFNTSCYQINTNYADRFKRPRLGDDFFDTRDNPAMYMVANVGITFDLQAIRDALPGVSIRRFRSVCGVDKRLEPVSMDIWVLVDGQLRYSRRKVSSTDQAEQVDIVS